MAGRPIEPRFALGERLYRRLEKRNIDAKGCVKPGALRPQVSVNRDRWDQGGARAALPPPSKFNGYASISVHEVRAVPLPEELFVVVLDDPLPDNEAHALVAIGTTRTPDDDIEGAVEEAKANLAAGMRLDRKPV